MSFYDWIYSNYPPDCVINGRWGTLHIAVVVLCVALIVGISFLRNKDLKYRLLAIRILVGCILILELARRIINLSRGDSSTLHDYAYLLLPRPWCAISCWLLIISVFVNKKLLYSFSAANALLSSLVFFAYPSVGFNHSVILFENFYSIATHALLLVTSISLMTLGLTNYRYEKKTLIPFVALLAGVFLYATAEILLKIEADPLYFLPGNDVQDFLGVDHGLFLVIYVVFLFIYFNCFFLVQTLITRKKPQPV